VARDAKSDPPKSPPAEDMVRALAKLLDETGLTEIEIERPAGACAWRAPGRPSPMRRRPPSGAAPGHRGGTSDRSRGPSGRRAVAHGRFRLSLAEPGAKPFVDIGSRVQPGDTLLNHRGDEDPEPRFRRRAPAP